MATSLELEISKNYFKDFYTRNSKVCLQKCFETLNEMLAKMGEIW